MKPSAFSFHTAESIQHALELLEAAGDEAKLLAGGQSLIPLMNFRLARPEVLIDVCRVPESDRIVIDSAGVHFGHSVRHRDALMSDEVKVASPLVGQALRWVGHEAIRSSGTLCGSTVHADPAAELPAIWLALGAEMTIDGPRGERRVPAESFFKSFLTTALEADEMLTAVHVPHAPNADLRRTAFAEVARRHGDFAIVGAAVVLDLDESHEIAGARISVLGASEVPMRIPMAEAALLGAQLDDKEARASAEHEVRTAIKPSDDSHASARYRKSVTGTLVGRALAQCVEDRSKRGQAS